MLFYFIKFLSWFSIPIYFKKRILQCDELINLKGPAIIAANHPNSMMDAVLIGKYCNKRPHYMIRSDMFNNPLFRWLLKRMRGIPVYRFTEEKGKLKKNFNSFELCKEVLRKNGIILIFPEGATELDWRLKPMKSGISKLISYCLEDPTLNKELKVLPVCFTYNCYDRFAKTVIIKSSQPFFPGKIEKGNSHGDWKKKFNAILFDKLKMLAPNMTSLEKKNEKVWKIILTNFYQVNRNSSQLVERLQRIASVVENVEIDNKEFSEIGNSYEVAIKLRNKLWAALIAITLFFPAVAGILVNGPFYFPIRHWVRNKTRGTIFFDSLLYGLLTIFYPFYVLILSVAIHLITATPSWYWIIAIPLTGWLLMQWFTKVSAITNSISLKIHEKRLLRKVMSYAADNTQR